MKRRRFIGGSMVGGIPMAAAAEQAGVKRGRALPAGVAPAAFANVRSGYSPFTTPDYYTYADDLVIERNQAGRPHQGKVLAAVQAQDRKSVV